MSKKNLVIVESPAKAKTIEKYLGKDYLVKSSYGHIRDLDKGDNAIDIKNSYKPRYIVPADKKKVVKELKELASQAETIWLASDEDREGEAISWHLFDELGLSTSNTKRIVFNEITQPAIEKAILNPRSIDINLVNAQQARRVLDRLVGFELSPLLWRKVKPSLSAGRVQSVAVRLVVEREREIRDFQSKSDFRVVAQFNAEGKIFKAVLNKRFPSEKEAYQFLELSLSTRFSVNKIETKPTQRNPSPPFTTSTLQQEASRKLGLPVGITMQLAQKLYEEGHITYMRTDSVNLSETALQAAKQAILSEFGDNYLHTRQFTTKSTGAQEAHEAIRPTNFNIQFAGGTEREKKLYNLIWKRSIASQMASAKLEKTLIDILGNNHSELYIAEGEVIKFDGFLKVYMESNDDDDSEENEGILPAVIPGQPLEVIEIAAEEKFSKAPPRYTEASLVKKLEELGIGRPSTYAPTISTIQKRGYVEVGKKEGTPRETVLLIAQNQVVSKKTTKEKTGSEKGKLIPTDIGSLVTDFLFQHFKDIMDYGFTASVEKEFDDIAQGMVQWNNMIDGFYHPFHELVDKTLQTAEKVTGEREIGTDPKTGKPIIAKMGKFGPYVQLGISSEDEKPVYASLRAGQNLETISLDEALELFKLPRNVGQFEDLDMVVNIGRYGPYVLHNKKFYSLAQGMDPLTVTLEEAIQIIKDKRNEDKDSDKLPLQLGEWEGNEIEANKGRFGPYIKYKGKFHSLPKDVALLTLTREEAIGILSEKLEADKNKIIRSIGSGKEEVQVLNGRYGPYFTYKGKNYKLGTLTPADLNLEKALEIVKNSGDNKKKTKTTKRK